jgi:hypothetical protein
MRRARWHLEYETGTQCWPQGNNVVPGKSMMLVGSRRNLGAIEIIRNATDCSGEIARAQFFCSASVHCDACFQLMNGMDVLSLHFRDVRNGTTSQSPESLQRIHFLGRAT